MNPRELDLAELFAVIWAMAKRNIGPCLLVGALVFALGLVRDVWFFEALWGDFAILLVQFVAGYFLSEALARETGLIGDGEGPGFGAYFVLSLMYGFGTGLASLLLVIPGLLLSAKWMLSFPILFDREQDAQGSDVLHRSWEMASGQTFWRLFAAYLLTLLPTVGSILVYLQVDEETGTVPYVAFAVSNALNALSVVFTLLLAFSAYKLLRNDDAETAQVFT